MDVRSLSTMAGAEKMETETIVGPLLGVLFIDPLWVLTTISMKSVCDEEIIVVRYTRLICAPF